MCALLTVMALSSRRCEYEVDSLEDQRHFAVGNYNGVFIKTYFAINEDGTVEVVPEASSKSDATAESLRK